jgi:hypothetical protein
VKDELTTGDNAAAADHALGRWRIVLAVETSREARNRRVEVIRR